MIEIIQIIHDITEILLKVALNTINQTKLSMNYIKQIRICINCVIVMNYIWYVI